MTTANVTRDWEPALTLKEAGKVGIRKDEYESGCQYARMAVEEHQDLGTLRDSWEPGKVHSDSLAAPYIADGQQELNTRLEKEADPPLEEAQGLNENVKANLDEIAEDREPITAREAGNRYSVAEAVNLVGRHDEKIKRDETSGRHHHNRAGALLRYLATSAPWVEAVGFLTFITFYLNVPVWEPWQDWLGWSFAATVVLAIILGQTWLVRHAAKNHNHAREDRVENHRHEAERGFRRRNWYLVLTSVTAAAVTSGMIWRGLAALGNASIGTTAVLVFVAVVTGLLLPTLAYLGIALDGSTISRERDGLAADLDADLDAYLATVSDSRRDLARVAEIGDALTEKTFPGICHTTQEVVDGIYEFYGTVRLLIGGLAADPPPRTTKTIQYDAAGRIHGFIGTSIPGVGQVSLEPLFVRQHHLEGIRAQSAGLLSRIDALPQHPWGTSRI